MLRRTISGIAGLSCLLFAYSAQAQVLQSWQDSRAYKPLPVLFLHGFAKGSPADWQGLINSLQAYFLPYQPLGKYLETLDFQDPNGSIETYPAGKLNPQGNNQGWADKLALKVNELLAANRYGSYAQELNIVAHSMGGLAARYYVGTTSLSGVRKLVLVGVPNLGTPLSTIANGLALVPKIGWSSFSGASIQMLTGSYVILDAIFQNLLEIDFNGYAVDAIDKTMLGNGFISYLNKMQGSDAIDNFAIVSKIGHILNFILFQEWQGGDAIVSKDSQLGTGYLSLKNTIYFESVHWKEPQTLALQKENPVLKILDSDLPVLQLTEPAGNEIETAENSITLKGRLFKEYLPADTKLVVAIENTTGPETYPLQESPMLPTDLWQAKQADSAVAEFNAKVNLPAKGKFKLCLKAVNPAGFSSNEINLIVTSALTAGPQLEFWQPQGEIGDALPLIYARFRSRDNAPIVEGSLAMRLDGNLVTATKIINADDPQLAEIYYTPATALAAGEHKVSVSAADSTGRDSQQEWKFKVIDPRAGPEPAPAGYSWGSVSNSILVEYSALQYAPLTLWEVTGLNFQQKLQEVKVSAINAGGKEIHEDNVMGLYLNWQGKDDYLDGQGQVTFEAINRQALKYAVTLYPQSIPVYMMLSFQGNEGIGVNYIKNVRLTIDDKLSLSFDKKYQQALFWRLDPSYPHHCLSPLLPYYSPEINVIYQFDPAEYELSDNNDLQGWPHRFSVIERTRFSFTLGVLGWRKQ